MLSHRRLFLIVISFSLLAVAGLSRQSHAGFEWVPGEQTQAPPAAPPVAVDLSPLGTATLAPLPGQEGGALPLPEAQPMKTRTISTPDGGRPMSAQDYEAHEIQMMNAPPPMVPPSSAQAVRPLSDADRHLQAGQTPAQGQMIAPPPPSPAGSYEVVEGFGDDMPLALALRQVVPPRYAFSFHPGVNAGIRVSWKGGRPWLDIVSGMIEPLGMEAQVRDNVLVIKTRSGGLPPQAAAAPVPHMPEIETQSGNLAPALDAPSSPQAGGSALSRRNMITDPGHTQTVQPAPGKASALAPASPSASIPAPQQANNVSAIWQARQGESLKETLERWSDQADMGLIWNARKDYALNSNFMISGSFDTAVKALLAKAVLDAPQYGFDAADAKNLVIQDRAG